MQSIWASFSREIKGVESVIESGHCIRAGQRVDQIENLLHQAKELELCHVKGALSTQGASRSL